MPTNVFVAGAGGFGREVRVYLEELERVHGAVRFAGFLDDHAPEVAQTISDYQPADNDKVVVALGDPRLRALIFTRLARAGARLHTVIHPTAWVAPTATIGSGCIIAPFAFVANGARVATNVAINAYASVGHDSVVASHCVLSPYAVINGDAQVGEQVFFGTHATLVRGGVAGAGSKLSAGSVATRIIPPCSLAVGNPARTRVMFPDIEHYEDSLDVE